MNYDCHLFVEIIESIHGVEFLREDTENGFRVRLYQGPRGRVVLIDTTDEDITESCGIGFLTELGLEQLIPSLFSKEKIEEASEAEEPVPLFPPEKETLI